VDAQAATHLFVLDGDGIASATSDDARTSVDPTRHLHRLTANGPVTPVGANPRAHALDLATLACAAELLGAGESLLAQTVEYAGARQQFGHPIGEYQSLKHMLADVRVE